MLPSTLLCIYNRISRWYDPENRVPSPRNSEEGGGRPRPRALDTNYAKRHWNMSQARGDSMLKLTANREPLTHKASEQAQFARTVDIRQCYITNDSVVDGNSSTPLCTEYSNDFVVDGNCSTPLCTEYSELRNSQNSRLQAISNHMKIGPTSEIEYSNLQGSGHRSASTVTTTEHVKSWVCLSRGVEQCAQ